MRQERGTDTMEKNIEELKNSLLHNMPTLFLGAGFSREAVCKSGIMPTGTELKDELYKTFIADIVNEKDGIQIQSGNLREICDNIDSLLTNGKKEREKFLTERLKGAWPNEKGFHNLLLKYPWKRIYTVNIDDLVENIYESANKKYRSISSRKDVPEHREGMELIKLHGCVRNADEGYVFSKKEYNALINQKVNLGLIEFSNEIYSSNDIIFIGASMDEPDLDYYLQLYEDLEIKRKKSKMFFIEPSPNYTLKQWANRLGAEIIEWNTEQFLEFVSALNYNPEKGECARLELNRNMVYRLKDDIKIFKEQYDSNIYQGFSCNWQDVFERWTFEHSVYLKALQELKVLLKMEAKTKCFCIYGSSFAGKSTLLKQLGYYLFKENFEVLEYKGTYFNRKVIIDYINKSDFDKYAILIDNAAYYYPVIEQILKTDYSAKAVIVICASRTYYHGKKKYYLKGSCLREYDCEDCIKYKDAEKIYETLDAKDALSYLYDLNEEERIVEIAKKKTVINLLLELTYGKGIRKKLQREMHILQKIPDREEQLLLEIAIFSFANIEYYPMELFVEKYGKSVTFSEELNHDINDLRISDYVKYDERGISLRNSVFQDEIMRAKRAEVYKTVVDLLVRIAPYVYEGRRDIWTIIFQSLCNGRQLRERFKLSDSQQDNLLKGLKEKYESISYYWLQRGLYEQSQGDYPKAFSHLKKSQSIQPKSFKIQHAIARNYLKFANSQKNINLAMPLFKEGEKLMKQLIDSNEYYIEKAKAFSVDSYVLEKVRYIERFNVNVTNKELCEMRDMLDRIYSDTDPYIYMPMRMFYILLQKKGKLSLLRMNLNNPYLEIMKKNLDIQKDMEEDYY